MSIVSSELSDRIQLFDYIDKLVNDLELFFRLKLENTGMQLQADIDSIKSICEDRKIDSRVYEERYNQEVEKRYIISQPKNL